MSVDHAQGEHNREVEAAVEQQDEAVAPYEPGTQPCRLCRRWTPTAGDRGRCAGFGPAVVVVGSSPQTVWPETGAEDGAGCPRFGAREVAR